MLPTVIDKSLNIRNKASAPNLPGAPMASLRQERVIFSGFYSERQCAGCEYTKGRTTPTSLLFFVALTGLGTSLLMPVATDLFGAHWWVFVALPAGELVVILTAMSLLVVVRDTLQGPLESCPRCSGTMVLKYSGMYDFAFIPTPLELLLTILFIAGHVAIIFLAWNRA